MNLCRIFSNFNIYILIIFTIWIYILNKLVKGSIASHFLLTEAVKFMFSAKSLKQSLWRKAYSITYQCLKYTFNPIKMSVAYTGRIKCSKFLIFPTCNFKLKFCVTLSKHFSIKLGTKFSFAKPVTLLD